jgi:hypothetical protein
LRFPKIQSAGNPPPSTDKPAKAPEPHRGPTHSPNRGGLRQLALLGGSAGHSSTTTKVSLNSHICKASTRLRVLAALSFIPPAKPQLVRGFWQRIRSSQLQSLNPSVGSGCAQQSLNSSVGFGCASSPSSLHTPRWRQHSSKCGSPQR